MDIEVSESHFYFLSNNLFTSYTLLEGFKKLYDFTLNVDSLFESLCALYNEKIFKSQNEHQFEDDFILKVLELLEWHVVRQDEKIIQGKLEKPDFLLFTSQENKDAYLCTSKEARHSSNEHIAVIVESKAYTIPIDNKKIKDNPHFQILRYLSNLKIDFGFLTNGKFWRFYDNSKLSSQKVFYEIHLEEIIKYRDVEAFKYFYFIFNAKNFIPKSDDETQNAIRILIEQDNFNKTRIEDDLRSVIYGINGYDSLFEKIGACLYERLQDSHSLKEIYENSLYFIFRLLFIAYFEDKFEEILQKHSCFKEEISLFALLKQFDSNPKSFTGLVKLNRIFTLFNEGEPNLDMPIFNGGLFDPKIAPLLNTPKIFSNADLKEILESLFFTTLDSKTFRRDYKTLSITHLGSIYEGILSYFFEVAKEDIYYILYTEKRKETKSIEGYFDAYDFASLSKKYKNLKATHYKKGQIYLKNTSNSRKSSASFYTPESLTNYLISHSICVTDSNILTYKILDNACGSGHFLVSALNFITQEVVSNFESFPSFKAIYDIEAHSIRTNTAKYIKDYQIDESDIIKRLLLKRMIYGVDVNPFSIELTKLSLWIDSFIFGTPLSFIEHHIKCGNALVGSSIKEFNEFYYKQSTQDLFMQNFMQNFKVLSEVFMTLNDLKDTTEEEIKQSKHIFYTEILPKLSKLNRLLDFHTALSFFSKEQLKAIKGKEVDILDALEKGLDSEVLESIESLKKEYRFFHYEIAFPEVFTREKKGFDCIIGNPPWDKVKFSDDDFYSQYRSNYRTKKASEKKQIAYDLLAKPYIQELYDSQKAFIHALNIYYKKHYPLNYGSGDTNLFRLFVERNAKLLAEHAPLSYVLPSAIMFEEGSYALRKYILEQKSLEYFYSFENREGIFPDIDSRYKFALMKVNNTLPAKNHTIKTLSYLTDTDELKKAKISLTLNLIEKISPHQLALPELRDKTMLEILQKLYKSFPAFSFTWLDFRRELDMTNDKDLFIEGYKEGLLPLYEGKMIHQYNANFAPPHIFFRF